MTIRIAAPDDRDFGFLHPEATHESRFFHGVRIWRNVSWFALAAQLQRADDVDALIQAEDLAVARERFDNLPHQRDASRRELTALRDGYEASFSQHLPRRARLLATGDQPIHACLGDDQRLGIGLDGHGANLLGKLLMDLRSELATRATDPTVRQCGHEDAELDIGLACVHLLDQQQRHWRHFTGKDIEHILLCDACHDQLPVHPPLRKLCEDCFDELRSNTRHGDSGQPEIKIRPTPLRFAHRQTDLLPNLLAAAPLSHLAHIWMIMDRQGGIHRLDTATARSEHVARLPDNELNHECDVVLTCAPNGELIAIGEARGRHAVVIDAATGAIIQRLERDDYHHEHCRFPLALFESDGRTLLAHASQWNRLDISDPHSGERLTERNLKSGPGLDYFHADLLLSPDGKHMLDNGWVWHPMGVVRSFSLERWLHGSTWESEAGPSVHAYTMREYFWGGPVAWTDAHTIAIWGGDDGDTNLLPIVTLHDVRTGKRNGRIIGPTGALIALPLHLLSANDDGTCVWSTRTGERLAHDASFTAIAAHPLSGDILSLSARGLRISTLTIAP